MLKPVTAAELKEEQAIFTSAWNALKAYRSISYVGMPEEWQALIKWAEDLNSAYKDGSAAQQLAKSISLAVLEYLDTISRKETGRNG